jgi:hypothetical protein
VLEGDAVKPHGDGDAADERGVVLADQDHFKSPLFGSDGLASVTDCHTPRKRGIQYAAASRFITAGSGILDHSPEPVVGRHCAPTR